MAKYSESIMSRCRQRLGLEKDDISKDARIEGWTKEGILDECLKWEGIVGFTPLIFSWLEDLGIVKEVSSG